MELYIGPSPDNDAVASKVSQQRYEADEAATHFSVLSHLNEMDTIGDGLWGGVKRFFNDELPQLRGDITTILIENAIKHVHIDIGSDLGSLYAAYYVGLMQMPFSVTFHNTLPTEDEIRDAYRKAVSMLPGTDPEPTTAEVEEHLRTLCIGGRSAWATTHPLLIRKIVMLVLVRATTVYVTSQEAAYTLMQTFPRVQREYIGAPLGPIHDEAARAFIAEHSKGADTALPSG